MPRRDFIKLAGVAAATAAALGGPMNALADDAPAPVAIAIIGTAHIHFKNYLGMLLNRKDVKIKYVWDKNADRAQRGSMPYGLAAETDLKKILADPDIKAVIILSETNQHKELVMAAAEAGKHMFVEKPLGFNAEDSKTMCAAIEKAKLTFSTGYFMRTDPEIIFMKDQVDKGNLGKITRVRGSNCHNGSLGRWFDTDFRWMADPKIAGVGAFGDLGTHALDILMWICGDVDSIVSDIKVVTGNYGDCDESGEALIKFKSGVTGTLAAGWVDVANPVTFIISGTEGHIAIEHGMVFFNSSKVEGANGLQPWTTLPAHPPLPMDQFVDSIIGKGGSPLVTPAEACARVCVMEAAYESFKNHAWAKPV
jgi:predicted dehydrogenase